ncbi:MAG: hypothetical protein V3T86_06270 [Planctomycetota bacterium]
MGRIDRKALLELAGREIEDSDHTPNERNCEAHYYVGCKQLIAANEATALDSFRACVATNETQFMEYIAALPKIEQLDPDVKRRR